MAGIRNYRVQGEIARGGMGVVYRAHDEARRRDVALKVLLEPDPRLRQEVAALTRLDHPGIVAFYELIQDDAGRDVIVMELIEGQSLAAHLKRPGGLTLEEALDYALQLCDAMAYAHAQGVLHRDLKPANALVTPAGQIKLADFGLGKVVDPSHARSLASLTQSGEVLGTPAYMPPEQATGEKARIGPTADVYGLGATLFALLTGRPPFRGATPLNVLHTLVSDPPQPPSRLRPDVPPALDAVVLRCLAKEPEDRFPTVEALRAALHDAARPVPHVAVGWLAPGLVALGLAIALGILAASRTQTDPAPLAATPSATPRPDTPALSDPESTPEPAPTPSGDAREALRAYARGVRLNNARRPDEALLAFEEALRLDPRHPDSWAGKGRARIELGDLERALADLSRAIELTRDPSKLAEGYVLRAFVHHRLGDLERALADANQALSLAPGHGAAHRARGALRMKAGDARGALADFDQALRDVEGVSPEELRQRLADRGQVRVHLGDTGGGLEDLSQAIELDPDRAEAYADRALVHTRRGELAQALADFDTSLDLGPTLSNRPSILFQRAQVRGMLDDQSGALADLDEVVAIDPRHADAHLGRNELRLRLEDLARVIADAPALFELGAEAAAKGRSLRGHAYAQREEYAEAIADYDQAIQLDPNLAQAWRNRGSVLNSLGDWTRALRDFDQALLLNPEDLTALQMRGLLRAEVGDLSGAHEDLSRLLDAMPDDPYGLWYRGRLNLLAHDLPAAAADLERALRVRFDAMVASWYAAATGDDQPLRDLASGDDLEAALAQHMLGDLPIAGLLEHVALADSAAERDERRALVQAYAGFRLDLAGQRDQAEPLYRAAVAAFPRKLFWIQTRLDAPLDDRLGR